MVVIVSVKVRQSDLEPAKVELVYSASGGLPEPIFCADTYTSLVRHSQSQQQSFAT